MKKTILKIGIGIILIPLLSYLGYMGYLSYLAPRTEATAATPEPTAAPPSVEDIVSAEGKVLPSQYVQLGFKSPGTIEEVLVAKGDQVEKGQVIARLEGHEALDASVTAARLELISAQQGRDDLNEHLELQRAQAQQDVIDAQDAVDEAQRLLNAVQTPPSEKQVAAAEDAVTLAEKRRAEAERRANSYKNRPEGDAERVAAELAYYAADAQYQKAIRYLNALQGGASEDDIAKAEASLALAQAQLVEAQRKQEILKNGPDPDEIALAEARLAKAKDQLAAAEAAREDLNLVAPFGGEIVSMNLKVGEVANPAAPGVVLADLSKWQVETTDLTENDVSLIAPGMSANITLNAFPDRKFKGVVKSIDRQGVESRGTVTYAVTLDFDPEDAAPRWEMSAFVEIMLR